MNCKRLLTLAGALFVGLLAFVSLTCDESLPAYHDPSNVLAFRVAKVEQLSDRLAPPGRQLVHVVLEGENVFDEVFQDTVNIRGSVRIWWKRKPIRFKTVNLSEANLVDRDLIVNHRLMLLPGQKFVMDFYWNLRTDDGIYLPKEMNFIYVRRRRCDSNVACADPEEFVIESSITVFDRLGVIVARPTEFQFTARVCIDCGFPPCPPPASGCG